MYLWGRLLKIDAIRHVQMTRRICVEGVHLFSTSAQHTVDFKPLRLSFKEQSLQRTWHVYMSHECGSPDVVYSEQRIQSSSVKENAICNGISLHKL